MDVQRAGVRKRRLLRRIVIGVFLLSAAGGITWAVSRLQPALPSVEAGSVYSGVVRRGPLLRQVHGTGSLVPEEVLWIAAQIDGRIEKINLQPGAEVAADTVIMELSNPALIEAMTAAEYDLKQAEAALTDLDVTLQSLRYDKEAAAAQVASDYQQAKIKAERDQKLADLGLIPKLDARLTLTEAGQLEIRNQIEERRLGIIGRSAEAQLAAQRVKIDQLRAIYELKQRQAADLRVAAGVSGILQQLGNSAATTPTAGGEISPLEIGQNVSAGAILAKIARPDRLKAQIRISETEAKDLAPGQPASIDTRNGVVEGRVTRIDPAAVNGTVLVDVSFKAPLPPGARPDLSVDGAIEIERLRDVVYVDRPPSGQPNSTISLFRVDAGDKTATRIPVTLGRASVNQIEILRGLGPGDKVILSDMTPMERYDRIRLN